LTPALRRATGAPAAGAEPRQDERAGREREDGETRDRRQARRADDGPTAGRGCHHGASGCHPLRPGLVEAGLELNRVVDRQPDEHGKHCDGPHRQRSAEQGHEAEREGTGRDRHAERQQAQRPRQDEQQGQRHDQTGDREQQQRLVAELPRTCVHHDRRAGDDVAAVAEFEARVIDRLLEEADRLVPLGVGQVGAEADDDLGGVPVREEVAEALLRGTGRLGLVEDDAAHEVRVVEPRDRGEPVLDRDLREAALELAHHLLGGGVGGLRLLRGRGAALRRGLLSLVGGGPRLLGRSADLALECLLDAGDAQIEEGRGPKDRVARAELRDSVTDRREGLLRLVGKYLRQLGAAREALLELEQRLEVLGQHEFPQVLLDEDDHRLIPELLVEVLSRLELGGPLADQGVGPSTRIQPCRGEDPRAGERHDREDHEPGPAHGHSRDPLKESPRVHEAEVREQI
jgi:hypothetical protein